MGPAHGHVVRDETAKKKDQFPDETAKKKDQFPDEPVQKKEHKFTSRRTTYHRHKGGIVGGGIIIVSAIFSNFVRGSLI